MNLSLAILGAATVVLEFLGGLPRLAVAGYLCIALIPTLGPGVAALLLLVATGVRALAGEAKVVWVRGLPALAAIGASAIPTGSPALTCLLVFGLTQGVLGPRELYRLELSAGLVGALAAVLWVESSGIACLLLLTLLPLRAALPLEKPPQDHLSVVEGLLRQVSGRDLEQARKGIQKLVERLIPAQKYELVTTVPESGVGRSAWETGRVQAQDGILAIPLEGAVMLLEDCHPQPEQLLTAVLLARLGGLVADAADGAEAQRETDRRVEESRHSLMIWVNGLKLLQQATEQINAVEREQLLDQLEAALKNLTSCDACAILDAEGNPVRESPPVEFPDALESLDQPLWSNTESLLAVADPGRLTVVLGSAQQGAFSSRHENMLWLLVRQASAALENARLMRETEESYRQLKESRLQLVQSSKLAAVGELAAGVAHELNTPLWTVLLALQSVTLDLEEGAGKTRLLKATDEVRRAREIVDQLLNYARGSLQPEIRPLNLKDSVENLVTLLEPALSQSEVKLRTELKDSPLKGVAGEVQQVATNLILNARDAISQAESEDRDILVECWSENGHACLRVSDSGVGIPEGDLERIFDSFFSTKQSTGLGLGVSRQIMARHGGQLTAGHRPGGGAVFTARFPAEGSDL